ncbi:2-keto-4-pentenoate hydratase [Corynebacterium lubricantis]|uniref:2-keto-4-pentenoate hydratase n=1 Tax=Corynebacterium lubricantis TaxID=541095 RepID=UPI0003604E59|nr:fumarylacetoacetate hydrolase family protein [Corynebacterium lubricantis]
MTNTAGITEIAKQLDTAKTSATATPQLGAELTISQAYEVQAEQLRLHRDRGEKYLGPKLGFTSHAKMEQMGVDSIIVGFLTDAMELDGSQPIGLEGYIHPRIEPELVFRLGDEVVPSAEDSPEELADRIRAATTDVAVGMELIDSRYEDFKFSLTDVVADNTSAAGFIVDKWQSFPRELSGLAVEFEINGDVAETATSDAILGNPDNAFLELAKMALTYEIELSAGAIILAGAMTSAVWLAPNQTVTARVEGFPELTVRTETV